MGILQALRLAEWWDKLATHLIACALLVYASAWQDYAVPFAFSTIYCIAYLSFAYSLNSLSDIREDLAAGKRRDAKGAKAIAALSGLFSLAIPLAFLRQDLALLGLLASLLAAFYSLRPLRFKENALLGVFVPAVAQRPLPFFFFVLLGGLQSADAAYLFGWLFLAGVYSILVHQVKDFGNDMRAGTRTLATRIGKPGAAALRDASLLALAAYSLAAFLVLPTGLLYSAALVSVVVAGFARQCIF